MSTASAKQIRSAKRLRVTPQKPDFDLSSAFHYTIHNDTSSVPLLISIPDPGDECPITAMPISDPSATADLTFIPENLRVFCPARPTHTKATLPCGHSFSAMHLLYYWARKSMRCPCCRDGTDAPATTESIPKHFRSEMARKIESSMVQEALEVDEENQQAAFFVAQALRAEASLAHSYSAISFTSDYDEDVTGFYGRQFSYVDLATEGLLSLRVTYYERNQESDLLRMNVVLSSMLHSDPESGARIRREVLQHVEGANGARRIIVAHHGEGGNMPREEQEALVAAFPSLVRDMSQRTFVPGRNTITTINQLMQGGFRMFKLSVVARFPGARSPVDIETSDRITVSAETMRDCRLILSGNSRSLGAGISVSQFHINFADEEQLKISSIEWVPHEGHLNWFRME